jgi:signal recognition particle GTPase
MEDDDDYPIINIPDKEEEEIEEEDIEEPQEFFKKPEMNLKEKRLENLRKAREARKKKKETIPKIEQEIITNNINNIDYDKLVNSIVDKLEDNKAKRKAKKIDQPQPVQSVQSVQPVQQVRQTNQYESLFGF